MVEISRKFMLFASSSRATARTQSAQSNTGPISFAVVESVLPISAASAFSFGSCKEGWYYRCLGVDP